MLLTQLGKPKRAFKRAAPDSALPAQPAAQGNENDHDGPEDVRHRPARGLSGSAPPVERRKRHTDQDSPGNRAL